MNGFAKSLMLIIIKGFLTEIFAYLTFLYFFDFLMSAMDL